MDVLFESISLVPPCMQPFSFPSFTPPSGRSQIFLSPEPLGHRTIQFIGNLTFAVRVACTGLDQGSPQVVGILGSLREVLNLSVY